MKIKNYAFGGIAVAIFGLSGITTARATDIASTNYVNNRVGTLSSLDTKNQDNAVAAINEVNKKVGTLSSLNTESQGDTVSAINEVNKKVGDVAGDVTTLTEVVMGEGGSGGILNEDGEIYGSQIADGTVSEGKLDSDLAGKINGKEDKDNKASAGEVEGFKSNEDKYTSVPAAYKIATSVAAEALAGAGYNTDTGIDGSKIADGTVSESKLDSSLKDKIDSVDGKQPKSTEAEQLGTADGGWTSLEGTDTIKDIKTNITTVEGKITTVEGNITSMQATINGLGNTYQKTANMAGADGISDGESNETEYPSVAAAYAIAQSVAGDKLDSILIDGDKIDGSKITNLQITSTELQENSVLTKHIANEQVTNDKLAQNAVAAANIKDGAVETNKILDENVTVKKLSKDLQDSLEQLINADCTGKELCVLSYKGTNGEGAFSWTGVKNETD